MTVIWRDWDKIIETEPKILEIKEDSTLSLEWNKFLRYVNTDEFASHFRDFSGVDVTKCKAFGFTAYENPII